MPPRSRGRCFRALPVLAALSGALAAFGQPPAPATPPAGADPEPADAVNRPLAARRLVQEFTFDDPEPFAVPRHWDLAQDGAGLAGPRPGYPRWNTAELDTAAAFRGPGSVRLSAAGGSVCLRLEPGVVPVFPDGEYLVSCKVRTQNLEHARAALTARYLDKSSRPIAASEARSDLVLGGGNAWVGLTVPLASGFAEAAYIQIDLEILQPERFTPAELGRHQVWAQDFAGVAWFDDVAVVQLPRVRIGTASPLNIVERPDKPAIRIMIRDLTGETMTGDLTVQDARGRVIDRTTRAMDSGLSRWEWTPKLTDLGWYRATLELRTGERRVGATRVDFVWLAEPERARAGDASGAPRPALSSPRDASRFAILLDELPAGQRALLPDLLARAGAGSVSLPVWSPGLKAAEVPALAQDLVPLVEKLRADWRRISFSLPRLPDELATAAHVEAGRPLAVFGTERALWAPYIDPLLDKFGQGVQRWQVGRPGSTFAESDLGAPLDALHAALARLVPGPIVAVPWPGDLTPSPALAADPRLQLLASIPPGMPAEGLPVLGEMWTAPRQAAPPAKPAATTLVLTPLPESHFSRRDAAAQLIKSAVSLWAAVPVDEADATPARPPPTLALAQPWDWPGPGRDQVMPRAELAAFRTLTERLRGRRIAGILPTPGATCYILAPEPGAAGPRRAGALVAWQSGATDGPVAIDAFLGQGPITLVDLFGNGRPLPALAIDAASEASGASTHRVPLSDEPVFVEGVDVELALFAASFSLDPSRLPPTADEKDLAVLLSNPWPTPVEGRITILEPGGLSEDPSQRDRSWRIAPRSTTFAIPPGQTARVPLTVAFSAVEEAGPKDFVAQIDLAGTRAYGPIRLRATLEVGLHSSPLDLSYQVSGENLELEAQVTNRAGGAATFELAAFAPGYARLKASVSDLPPGASATRRFSFPGGAAKLRGQRITVSLQDLETRARVNRSVVLE